MRNIERQRLYKITIIGLQCCDSFQLRRNLSLSLVICVDESYLPVYHWSCLVTLIRIWCPRQLVLVEYTCGETIVASAQRERDKPGTHACADSRWNRKREEKVRRREEERGRKKENPSEWEGGRGRKRRRET